MQFRGAWATFSLVADGRASPPSTCTSRSRRLTSQTVQRVPRRGARRRGTASNGEPGERPHYHPGYYAAFALDPDGNNIESVFHGGASG